MPATADFTGTSFTIADIFIAFEGVYMDANVFLTANDLYSGTALTYGFSRPFEITGTDFTFLVAGTGLHPDAGVIETMMTFRSNGAVIEEFRLTDLGIDAAALAAIRITEFDESAPFGIEDLLMDRDWDIRLGDGADRAGEGTLVGDGRALNLRGDDTIDGGGGNDVLFAGLGRDKLIGGTGNDRLAGGKNADLLNGGRGNDQISGGTGHDTLRGDKGRDTMNGGAGNDGLSGGRSADTLLGSTGDDMLTGGRGADRFVFESGNETATITDFEQALKKEVIDLAAVKGITGFRDLMNNHIRDNAAGNAVITDEGGLRIRIEDLGMADLDQNDFVF